MAALGLNSMEPKQKVLALFRWVVLLPGAIAASYACYYVIWFLEGNAMALSGANPESFFGKALLIYTSQACMGGIFVICGAKIAPFQQTNSAYALGVIGLVGIGIISFPAITTLAYWSLFGAASFIFGLCAALYAINKGEIKLAP